MLLKQQHICYSWNRCWSVLTFSPLFLLPISIIPPALHLAFPLSLYTQCSNLCKFNLLLLNIVAEYHCSITCSSINIFSIILSHSPILIKIHVIEIALECVFVHLFSPPWRKIAAWLWTLFLCGCVEGGPRGYLLLVFSQWEGLLVPSWDVPRPLVPHHFFWGWVAHFH